MENKRTIKKLYNYIIIMQGILCNVKFDLCNEYYFDEQYFKNNWLELSKIEVDKINEIIKKLINKSKELIFLHEYWMSELQELMLRIFELNKFDIIIESFWNKEEKEEYTDLTSKINKLIWYKKIF